MAKEAELRYQSWDEMLGDIRAQLEGRERLDFDRGNEAEAARRAPGGAGSSDRVERARRTPPLRRRRRGRVPGIRARSPAIRTASTRRHRSRARAGARSAPRTRTAIRRSRRRSLVRPPPASRCAGQLNKDAIDTPRERGGAVPSRCSRRCVEARPASPCSPANLAEARTALGEGGPGGIGGGSRAVAGAPRARGRARPLAQGHPGAARAAPTARRLGEGLHDRALAALRARLRRRADGPRLEHRRPDADPRERLPGPRRALRLLARRGRAGADPGRGLREERVPRGDGDGPLGRRRVRRIRARPRGGSEEGEGGARARAPARGDALLRPRSRRPVGPRLAERGARAVVRVRLRGRSRARSTRRARRLAGRSWYPSSSKASSAATGRTSRSRSPTRGLALCGWVWRSLRLRRAPALRARRGREERRMARLLPPQDGRGSRHRGRRARTPRAKDRRPCQSTAVCSNASDQESPPCSLSTGRTASFEAYQVSGHERESSLCR